MRSFLRKCLYLCPSSYCLMFHHIDDGKIMKKSSCVLSIEKFIDILDSGIEFISVDEYVSFSGKTINKCVITFDDGLKDVYTVAYPELKKRQIPFTIFVIVDYLDTEGYITTEELIELSKDPLVSIGAHGMTHDVLTGLSIEKQKYEMFSSKKYLEEIIGKKVDFFAFSHGGYDKNTLRILKSSAKYKFAFGVRRTPTNFITRWWKYHLPRLNCVNEHESFKIIARKNKKILKMNL